MLPRINHIHVLAALSVRTPVRPSCIRFRAITLLFVVGLKCVARKNSGRYIKGQGHSTTLKQIRFPAIPLLFMVDFRYCLLQFVALIILVW